MVIILNSFDEKKYNMTTGFSFYQIEKNIKYLVHVTFKNKNGIHLITIDRKSNQMTKRLIQIKKKFVQHKSIIITIYLECTS